MTGEQLLSLKRQGIPTNACVTNKTKHDWDLMSITTALFFYTEFRSLQDKTQVIPLSSTDFCTYTSDAQSRSKCCGAVIGKKSGVQNLRKHPALQEIHGYKPNDFGAIVAAAALAHDIGNPPFGHSWRKGHWTFF